LARSETDAILPITAQLNFPRDAHAIDCEVTVENTVRDHALRVLFPTARSTDYFYTDSAFDLVQRPVTPPDYRGWNEIVDEMVPQQCMVAVHDNEAGLCLLSRGLPAVNVRPDPLRTIALTLLRGYRRVIMQPGEGGQVLGSHQFRFSIFRFGVTPDLLARLCQQAAAYRSGLRTITRPLRPGLGPRQQCYLTVEPAALRVSALKAAEDQDGLYVLRVYNPTLSPVDGKISFQRKPSECRVSNLNEEAGDPIAVDSQGATHIHVGAKKILTLLFRW
jgi:alpha-mannosidase